MKSKLHWKSVNRQALADHLETGKIVSAQAIGENNLYHCLHDQVESIAISLPGTSVIIGLTPSVSPGQERRRRRRATPLEEESAKPDANISPSDNSR